MATSNFYRRMYANTSYREGIDAQRVADHARVVRGWMARLGVGSRSAVLEIGAGHGDLHAVHPRWRGVEYSPVAVRQGVKRNGKIRLMQGDATRLAAPTGSLDFVFSFATLEHVPQIEKALREIMRVLKPGGVVLLAPAWNCRPWTVEKLPQRPYAELNLRQKIGKFLIPLRENILFRLLQALPLRLWREAKLLAGVRLALDYTPLQPQAALIERYGHVADDDAFVSLDAHAAIAYFRSRGYGVVSHPGLLRRLACRGEPVVVVKPR